MATLFLFYKHTNVTIDRDGDVQGHGRTAAAITMSIKVDATSGKIASSKFITLSNLNYFLYATQVSDLSTRGS